MEFYEEILINTKLFIKKYPIPIGVTVFVVGAWLLTWYLLGDSQDRGTFGDMFGAVNALFSGLAFVGVIYAIMLQSKELRLQRNELEFTRLELEGQKKQLEAQNVTLEKQNFENTFFQLLRLHNDIIGSIDLVSPEHGTTKGRDCFKVFYDRLARAWGRNSEAFRGNSEQDRINNTYMAFYGGHEAEIGHYFRSLYNLVKFVDNSLVDEKRLYTNLIRSQLSSFELLLLFYNALSETGRDNFKPLIEEYSLLKSVPRKSLLNSDAHISCYELSAY